MIKISVGIPVYEMPPFGIEFLNHNLKSIEKQTVKPFEVIVSDDSKNNHIELWLANQTFNFPIRYVKNQSLIKNPCQNHNNILSYAQGDYVKILHQDDFLVSNTYLDIISKEIQIHQPQWLFTSFGHSYDGERIFDSRVPKLNPNILFNNTLGAPSNLTIKNSTQKVYFNLNYIQYYDTLFYIEYLIRYGKPLIITDVQVGIRHWSNQITHNQSDLLGSEAKLLKKIYKKNITDHIL